MGRGSRAPRPAARGRGRAPRAHRYSSHRELPLDPRMRPERLEHPTFDHPQQNVRVGATALICITTNISSVKLASPGLRETESRPTTAFAIYVPSDSTIALATQGWRRSGGWGLVRTIAFVVRGRAVSAAGPRGSRPASRAPGQLRRAAPTLREPPSAHRRRCSARWGPRSRRPRRPGTWSSPVAGPSTRWVEQTICLGKVGQDAPAARRNSRRGPASGSSRRSARPLGRRPGDECDRANRPSRRRACRRKMSCAGWCERLVKVAGPPRRTA